MLQSISDGTQYERSQVITKVILDSLQLLHSGNINYMKGQNAQADRLDFTRLALSVDIVFHTRQLIGHIAEQLFAFKELGIKELFITSNQCNAIVSFGQVTGAVLWQITENLYTYSIFLYGFCKYTQILDLSKDNGFKLSSSIPTDSTLQGKILVIVKNEEDNDSQTNDEEQFSNISDQGEARNVTKNQEKEEKPNGFQQILQNNIQLKAKATTDGDHLDVFSGFSILASLNELNKSFISKEDLQNNKHSQWFL